MHVELIAIAGALILVYIDSVIKWSLKDLVTVLSSLTRLSYASEHFKMDTSFIEVTSSVGISSNAFFLLPLVCIVSMAFSVEGNFV